MEFTFLADLALEFLNATGGALPSNILLRG